MFIYLFICSRFLFRLTCLCSLNCYIWYSLTATPVKNGNFVQYVCMYTFFKHILMSAGLHPFYYTKNKKNAIIDLCFSFDATHVERLYHIFRSCIKSSALKGELSQGMSCVLWSCVLNAGFDVPPLCWAADVCAYFFIFALGLACRLIRPVHLHFLQHCTVWGKIQCVVADKNQLLPKFLACVAKLYSYLRSH